MKKILVLMCAMLSTSSFGAVFFSQCMSYNNQPTGSYVSCVNRNFSKASRELDGAIMRNCFAFPGSNTISFTGCVSSNFQRIANEAQGALYLGYCYSFATDELSLSFMSCVNRNFNKIANYLNSQDQIDYEEQQRVN